jgi:putative Mg2+ transporter-C (MgtC) family protein
LAVRLSTADHCKAAEKSFPLAPAFRVFGALCPLETRFRHNPGNVRMLEVLDIFTRLGAAILIGGVIGLNRDLHHKPTGLRTLSLVALGSALAVLAVARNQSDVSRVIQGVITGVGFIGAGVILYRTSDETVHGLTTAAAIWVTAAMGVLCGLAAWRIVGVAAPLILALLILGGPVEKWFRDRLESEAEPKTLDSDPDA